MKTLKIIEGLIEKRGISRKTLTDFLGLNRNTWTDWSKGKSKTYYDKIADIAQYFDVTTDYLLGMSDTPQLVIPPALEGVQVAFHRGEFEGLTQAEVDALAAIAETFKNQRKNND